MRVYTAFNVSFGFSTNRDVPRGHDSEQSRFSTHFRTQHPSQHDAQLDYYGKRLATCSSDRTVKVFDVVDGDTQKATGHTLKGCVCPPQYQHASSNRAIDTLGPSGRLRGHIPSLATY